MSDLTAFALVCSLTPSPAPSSSDLMARHILDQFAERGITTSSARVVDHDVAPGVQKDMGNGDEWPALREKILAADMMQGLNDIGFSLPSQGSTYWVGEAMQSVDFKDLAEVPELVATTTAGVVRNAEHLAKLLRRENFPLE
ncbi:hypothetical protein ACX80H_10250 [Arthrobacter sp. MDT2-2]